MQSPIEQFEVIPLLNLEIYERKIDITLTNLFLANFIVIVFIFLLTYLIMPRSIRASAQENVTFFIPNRWQLLIEYQLLAISQLVTDNLGNNSEGQKFLPFIFTLFNIILFTNLVGLLPYSFTVTSHLIVTFLLSFSVFIGTTVVVCFQKHSFKMIKLFVPSNTSFLLTLLLVPIEFISYISKPIGQLIWFFLVLMFLTSGSPEFTLCDEVNSGPTAPATNAAAPSLTWAEICKEGVAACVIGYLVSNGTPAGFVVSTLMLMTLPIICRKNGGKSAGDATDGRTSPEEPKEVVAPLRGFAEDSPLGNHSSAVTLVEGNENAPEEGLQSTITRWVIESWSNFFSDLNSMEFSPALQELLNGHIKVFMQAVINYPGITSGVLVVLISWSCQYFSVAGPAIVFVKLMQGFRWPVAVLWGGAAAGAGAYASSGFWVGPPGPPIIPIPEPAPKPSSAVPTVKEVQKAAPLAERLRLAEMVRNQAHDALRAERDNLTAQEHAYQIAIDRARELTKDALRTRTEARWEASKMINSQIKRGLLVPLDLAKKRELVGEIVAPISEQLNIQLNHAHSDVFSAYRELQKSKDLVAAAEDSYWAAAMNVTQVRRQG